MGLHDRGDGNVDLELRRDRKRLLVQCKAWRSTPVGVDKIRKLGGTLMRQGLRGDAGVFVTLSDYTPQARTEAKHIGRELLDNRDLHVRVAKVRNVEPCPQCGALMRLGYARLVVSLLTNGCPGKRDLSREAGATVRFLTTSADDANAGN